MSLTHTTTIRNALANLVADAHDADTGSPAVTSVLEVQDGSTVLVTFDFVNPAFGAAASGIVTLLGVPIEVSASDDGIADNFVTRDRDGVQILAGTVTMTGFGGDIEVSNTNIANGQSCSLDELTYEAPP